VLRRTEPLVTVVSLVAEDVPAGSCQAEAGEFLAATIGPDGLTSTYVVMEESGGQALRACDFVRTGSSWQQCGTGYREWDSDAAVQEAGGGLSLTCFNGSRRVGYVWVTQPPEGAAWLLHERGRYSVVYPVQSGVPARISGTEIDPDESDAMTATVSYYSGDGALLGSATVEGAVAG
jgi:hypothetical protein